MLRFDQQNFDVQGTERVFKKVVHPGLHNIGFVDKNGVQQMRTPNHSAISRRSSYVLSPRGVPTRKSHHSYSGQVSNSSRMNGTLSKSAATELIYNLHYGLTSPASPTRQQFMPSTYSAKKRTFGSGPPRSSKPTKSASSERFLSSYPDRDYETPEDTEERWNQSPQGRRLEKEWSALSQCRALKRSSEIVSHRVDRMYFMSGNSIKLAPKYHVDDEEIHKLKALQQQRVSSRQSRHSSKKRGDFYIPDPGTPKTLSNFGAPSDIESEKLGKGSDLVIDTTKRKKSGHRSAGKRGANSGQVQNSQEEAQAQRPDSPKVLSKGSLQGWEANDDQESDKPTPVQSPEDIRKSLHEDVKEEVDVLSVSEHNGKPEEVPAEETSLTAGNGEQVVVEGQTVEEENEQDRVAEATDNTGKVDQPVDDSEHKVDQVDEGEDEDKEGGSVQKENGTLEEDGQVNNNKTEEDNIVGGGVQEEEVES